MTTRFPLATLIALTAIAGCEPEGEAAGVPEEEAAETRATTDSDATVVISLLDDGTVMLGDEEIAPAELTEALSGRETPEGVTLKAERDVTAGTVDEVQKALVAAGITKVRFLTSQQ